MPAPESDVMTPDVPERNPPAPAVAEETTAVGDPVLPEALTGADAVILFRALARVARIHGYSDEFMPEHTADIDSTGCDPRIAQIVEWAKHARLS